MRGLAEDIQDELTKEDLPATLDDVMMLATKIDNRLHHRRQDRSRHSFTSSSDSVTPMEIDSIVTAAIKAVMTSNKKSAPLGAEADARRTKA